MRTLRFHGNRGDWKVLDIDSEGLNLTICDAETDLPVGTASGKSVKEARSNALLMASSKQMMNALFEIIKILPKNNDDPLLFDIKRICLETLDEVLYNPKELKK